MKKILTLAAAAATLAIATGASAQPYPDRRGPPPPPPAQADAYGRYNPARAIDARRMELSGRIERGERSHRIDRREARRLRDDLREVGRMQRRFMDSRGLDRREVSILNGGLDRIERRIDRAMRDQGRPGHPHDWPEAGPRDHH